MPQKNVCACWGSWNIVFFALLFISNCNHTFICGGFYSTSSLTQIKKNRVVCVLDFKVQVSRGIYRFMVEIPFSVQLAKR